MNSEEPKKEVHFYGGCNTSGFYFIQNGNPEKVFSFGYGNCGELSNGKSYSTNNNIYQYPTPQFCTQIPKTGKVKQISKGNSHALFLMSPKEDVYGVGHSGYGALSTKQKEVLSPILLSSSAIKDKKISSVSCGCMFSVLLSEKGVPYSCGYNLYGQCGVGTNSHIYSAIPMKFNEKVIQIDCGEYYAVLLTNKRDIYKTGKIYNEGNVNIPTKLNLNEKVKYFRAGCYHLLVVGISEQLYGMGQNSYNQLTSNISKNGVKVLTKINSLNGKKIKDIKCGYEDSYALLENGELYGWGYNGHGQSKGTGSVTKSFPYNPTPFKMKSNVHHVEVGSSSCFAFCKDNCVYVCGYNRIGNLGMGHKTKTISTFTLNKNISNIKKVTPKIFKPPTVTVNVDFDPKKLISSTHHLSTTSSSQSSQVTFTFKSSNKTLKVNKDITSRSVKLRGKSTIPLDSIEFYKPVSVIILWLSGGEVKIGKNINDIVNTFKLACEWKLPNLVHLILNHVSTLSTDDIVDILIKTHANKTLEESSLTIKCFSLLKKITNENEIDKMSKRAEKDLKLMRKLFKEIRKKDDPSLVEKHKDLVGYKKRYNNSEAFQKHMKGLYKIDNDALKDICFKTCDGKYIKAHKSVLKRVKYFNDLLLKYSINPLIDVNFKCTPFCAIVIYIYDPKLFNVHLYTFENLIEISVNANYVGIKALSDLCLKQASVLVERKELKIDFVSLTKGNYEKDLKNRICEGQLKELRKLEKSVENSENVLGLKKELELSKKNALEEKEKKDLKLNELENKLKNAKNRIKELENSSLIANNQNENKETHKDYEIPHSEVLLLKKIGSGGFGKCYLSKWIRSGGDVDVVVKSIEFEGIKITSKKVFDEIKVQFNIRNPSICRIYGFSLPTPSKVYIIMEKMDFDVNKMIKKNKFTLVEKLKIMEKMTQSVQVIHSKNILHRDLKCANFLADKSGNIKLTDFGIATVMTHSQTHIQSGGKGSLPWMDPDLIDGNNDEDDEDEEEGEGEREEKKKNGFKVFSKETDIYSLGCCFYEVLFGKEPYSIMNGRFVKKAKKNKKIPLKVIEMLLSCIKDDKCERPTASELLKWFGKYSKI